MDRQKQIRERQARVKIECQGVIDPDAIRQIHARYGWPFSAQPRKRLARGKRCPQCLVNDLEYENDDLCPWCQEKTREY